MDLLEAALVEGERDVALVRSYYAPVARWCADLVSASARRPFVVGISGPQGGGKSTLAAALVRALGAVGLGGIAISIDDFYLTHAEQRALAAAHPGNRCLEHRGYPGTHDVELGCAVLDALRRGAPALVPVYDKSAHGGRGDRAPETRFRRVDVRLDFVILEGWMLGFSPVDPLALEPDLRAPNAMLAAYARWHERLDALVVLFAEDVLDVVRWRVGAERARRDRGEGALSDAEARDYVERFLPAYRAYVPGLRARPPCTRTLEVVLDAERGAASIREHAGRSV